MTNASRYAPHTVIAALFWTYILATFCEMLTNSNPEMVEFTQTSKESLLPHTDLRPRLPRPAMSVRARLCARGPLKRLVRSCLYVYSGRGQSLLREQ